MSLSGKLAHHHLKLVQHIRGEKKQHLQDIQTVLQYICDILNTHALMTCGVDVEELTWCTWEKVKRRDWVKYPETGLP
jgi:hypothetical protein